MHTHAHTHTYTHAHTEHFTINNTILHKYAVALSQNSTHKELVDIRYRWKNLCCLHFTASETEEKSKNAMQ